MFDTFFKKLLPVAAIGLGLTVSGCDGMNIRIGDKDGVPLADLDMSGDAPKGVVLAGPDTLVVTEGAKLDIKVEGDQAAVDALRFNLEEGTLGIMREKYSWKDGGTATVRVTMPLPEEVVIAGSGTATLPGMAKKAEVTIGGSGTVDVGTLAGESLEITIGGSGTVLAKGTVERLQMTVGGSGKAEMAGLKVDKAEINVGGSGDAQFASDGEVEANIAGSGDITVTGTAKCNIKAFGSGTLNCKPAAAPAAPGAPTAPAAPTAPETPEAPEPGE